MSKTFRKDLTGERFGRLTVIEFVPNDTRRSYWKCKCDCGNEVVVVGDSLNGGLIKSCGCYRIENARTIHMTHGKRGTRLYRIWYKMKSRCNNPNETGYERYGGREISVCGEWQNDFMAFYNWAMANGYADNLSIDRIDNDKGYSPDNCRWVDNKTQSRNRRSNTIIEYKGEKMTLAEASERSGIGREIISYRYRRGDRGEWLFRPVKK